MNFAVQFRCSSADHSSRESVKRPPTMRLRVLVRPVWRERSFSAPHRLRILRAYLFKAIRSRAAVVSLNRDSERASSGGRFASDDVRKIAVVCWHPVAARSRQARNWARSRAAHWILDWLAGLRYCWAACSFAGYQPFRCRRYWFWARSCLPRGETHTNRWSVREIWCRSVPVLIETRPTETSM